MPSTTEHIASQFPEMDSEAEAVLMNSGYRLHPDWSWSAPEGHTPTDREMAAIIYLIEEWDYAGLRTDNNPNIMPTFQAWNRQRAIKEGWAQ